MCSIIELMQKNKSAVKTIAEIGQAHDGSLGLAHSYIEALKNTGVDAIKFQIHIADAESSIKEKFRKKFSYKDKTRIDYWRRIEFSQNEWLELKKHCEHNNMEFIASPFSIAAMNLLKNIGQKVFKIASGEVDNYFLIDQIIQLKKEIIISSGLSNFKELDESVKRIKRKKIKLSVLQCTSSYPTKLDNIGLNVIKEMKERYNVPTGLSDHSGNPNILLAATALGADLLEFHVTFSKKSFGPDNSSSIEINKIQELIEGIRNIKSCINNPIDKNNLKKNSQIKKIFSKSMAINKDIKKNKIIVLSDLETKKPGGQGINAKNYLEIVGKKINKDMKKNSFLKKIDLKK